MPVSREPDRGAYIEFITKYLLSGELLEFYLGLGEQFAEAAIRQKEIPKEWWDKWHHQALKNRMSGALENQDPDAPHILNLRRFFENQENLTKPKHRMFWSLISPGKLIFARFFPLKSSSAER